MPLILPGNVGSATAATGFNVANSVNCGDTSTRFTGSAKVTSTSQQKGSWNIWLKRTVLGEQGLFKVYESANTGVEFKFDSSNQFLMREFESGSDVFNLKTSAAFRDTSAWMNILLAIDTTQGTEANRIRLYINGVEPSLATSTRPSVNTNLVRFFANGSDSSGQQHEMGNNYDGATGHYLLTQILYVDGTQLANTDVGEFDSDSGIWKPIDISGTTLGNNGYYLSMEDSSDFGTATGKSFTAHGFAATDSRIDTCTNNFATLNPLIFESSSNTFAEGNLKITGGGSDSWTTHYGLSTIAVSTGKWFVESKVTTVQDAQAILGLISTSEAIGSSLKDEGVLAVEKSGRITGGGNNLQTGLTAFSNGDIAGLAFDATNGTGQFYRNGSAYGSAVSSLASDTYYFATTTYESGGVIEFNFGSPPYSESGGNSDGDGFGNFSMAVPSGYFALNTKNLAEYG